MKLVVCVVEFIKNWAWNVRFEGPFVELGALDGMHAGLTGGEKLL